MDIMEKKWTYGLWGAAAGAIGFWIITAGITGWLVTGSSAARQSEAVFWTIGLGAVCVAR
jgi:hypothetical protein